jgi:hypothetical protein
MTDNKRLRVPSLAHKVPTQPALRAAASAARINANGKMINSATIKPRVKPNSITTRVTSSVSTKPLTQTGVFNMISPFLDESRLGRLPQAIAQPLITDHSFLIELDEYAPNR